MADSEIIFAVQESSEGGYEARALGHSIHTQAETLEELKVMLQDAVRCHFSPSAEFLDQRWSTPRHDPCP